MFNFKKRKKFEFEDVLEHFSKYKKDYALFYSQENGITTLKIESLVKPSKPPKRSSMILKTSKTNEKEKAD